MLPGPATRVADDSRPRDRRRSHCDRHSWTLKDGKELRPLVQPRPDRSPPRCSTRQGRPGTGPPSEASSSDLRCCSWPSSCLRPVARTASPLPSRPTLTSGRRHLSARADPTPVPVPTGRTARGRGAATPPVGDRPADSGRAGRRQPTRDAFLYGVSDTSGARRYETSRGDGPTVCRRAVGAACFGIGMRALRRCRGRFVGGPVGFRPMERRVLACGLHARVLRLRTHRGWVNGPKPGGFHSLRAPDACW